MIRLTWRQHRFESLIAVAFFGLFAAFMIPTGLHLAATYRGLGIGSCLATSSSPRCADAISIFWQQAGVTNIVGWANFLPLIFGTLLAAPFVLDLENGTYRMAWTQSVTRTRWTLTKIGLLVAGCVLVGASLSILMSWWRLPLDHLEGSISPNDAFDFEGIVPIFYVLFAVALVLTIGTLLRRIVPAIGLALVIFLVARPSIQHFLRPHYMTPVTKLTATKGEPTDTFGGRNWVIDSGLTYSNGRHLTGNPVAQLCGGAMSGLTKGTTTASDAVAGCLRQHHVFGYLTYQPANRFWVFQGIESAIYLGMSAALLAVALWWIRHRVA